MYLQQKTFGARQFVPPVRPVDAFANRAAVEGSMKLGDILPPPVVINDWLKRNRRQPQKDNRLPCYIEDDPPPGWKPSERPPVPDADRGVYEIQF